MRLPERTHLANGMPASLRRRIVVKEIPSDSLNDSMYLSDNFRAFVDAIAKLGARWL